MRVAAKSVQGTGAPKMPRSMMIKDVASSVKRAFRKYGESWGGKLYRAGTDGSYFHTSREGAEFYETPDAAVEEFPIPSFSRTILIDMDNEDHIGYIHALMGVDDPNLVDDISTLIEEARPKLRELGFDGMVIDGETGRGVEGVPVEVVKL